MRLALCTAVAESSAEARLLRQHGYTTRVAGNAAAADFTLPAPRGGALAFLMHSGQTANAGVAERAATASRASRRCTVLWTRPDVAAAATEEMQAMLAPGVSLLVCHSPEEAVEHMLACAERMATARAAPEAEAEVEAEQQRAVQAASAFLAALWGAEDVHASAFLLSSVTLSSLARVTSEEGWKRLVAETEGLIDGELLYAAVDWLQRDSTQVF